jgi:hypothetical protein
MVVTSEQGLRLTGGAASSVQIFLHFFPFLFSVSLVRKNSRRCWCVLVKFLHVCSTIASVVDKNSSKIQREFAHLLKNFGLFRRKHTIWCKCCCGVKRSNQRWLGWLETKKDLTEIDLFGRLFHFPHFIIPQEHSWCSSQQRGTKAMSKSRSFICKPDVLGQILTTTCSAFSKVSQSTCRLEAVTESLLQKRTLISTILPLDPSSCRNPTETKG